MNSSQQRPTPVESVDPSPNKKNTGLSASLRAPVIVWGNSSTIDAQIRVGEKLAIFHASSDVTRRGNTYYLLDGVGIQGSSTLANSNGVANFLHVDNNQNSEIVADRWGSGIKNPCAAFIANLDTQEVLCLPDPLGGAIAFRYKFSTFEIISTDISSLSIVVEALSLPLHKSADFQLERLILGNGGLFPASYENVDRLELFQYWHLSQKGVVRKNFYGGETERTYVESVAAIRDELIQSVLAISKLPTERRIAHITGGFDSRLVLAASMAAGCAKEFSYFCSGPAGSTDRIIADGLSRTLDLPRSAGAGLAASPVSSVHEQLLAPLFHSGGITSSGPNGGEATSDVVIVGGGYGGILRSTYSSRFAKITPENLSPAALMDSLAPRPAGNSHLYSDTTLSRLGAKLSRVWEELRADGFEHDSIGDAFYLSVRNRYHFGQNSMLWSRVGRRFDPLYSVSAVTAAARLPLYSRQTNVLGFDLMESFGVDLEKYPFDRNRFTDAYKTLRRPPMRLELSNAGPLKFDSSHQIAYSGKIDLPSAVEAFAVDSPILTETERKNAIEKANTIGLNYWQIATLGSAQSSLRAGLAEFGSKTTDGLINSDYITHLATDRLTKRTEIRDLYSVYGLLAWLSVR